MDSPLFRTSDLYYAAFLCYAKVPYSGVTWEGRRAWFLFSPITSLQGLKDEYYSGVAKVPALAFSLWVKKLRSELIR